MSSLIGWIAGHWWVFVVLFLIILFKPILRLVAGMVMVPDDSIGQVTKKFVLVGSNRELPPGRIVALKGEAGLQADTLPPGVHWLYFPWQFSIKFQKFVTIEKGKIGVVEARDGEPLSEGRVLGQVVTCDTYQDARAFISNHGERGPQMQIVPPGTYRINLALFSVSTVDVLEIPDNMVGIVTTKAGETLPSGEIAGKEVPGHNMFQDPQTFMINGGYRGLQEQVMLAGRYFINPYFATVETKEMTTVDIAHVGVVIAYVGEAGIDTTGADFKHGNLVSKGQKGVWAEPLDPGKYPINPFTHKVEQVPTANVVLNWANDKSESHKLDEKLCSITVRSSDGFNYNLDVSQIIHIPRNSAPKVIARFGSVANLVTQVLEPTIGNYFRNAAQNSDVIDFLRNRKERQDEARQSIGDALTEYDVGAVNTLIGDIVPPEALMKTLTDRKIAQQEKITYETQTQAEETRKGLQQARAQADTQARVVDAERSVQIAEFNASAVVKTAAGEAEAKTINAKADAEVLTVTGDALAKKTLAVGDAEAAVIQKKTTAVGQGNYATMEVARFLSENNIKLVPDIMVSGGVDGKNGGIIDVILANLALQQKSENAGAPNTNGVEPKAAEATAA
jgi:uncharacterized membrane protein YqiK